MAEANARCASLTIGFSEDVTVTIPSSTCTISATRLVVERITILLAFLYFVQTTMDIPRMKTPTTELNSR